MAEEESSQYIQEKCVLPNEELFKISGEDLELKLHRSIGALMFSDKNGNQAAGTGVLISRDIVLTSAHNIFDKKGNMRFMNFKFCLPTNGVADIFYAVEDVRYPPQFETCPQARKLQFDYALVKLKRQVSFNVGIPTLANQLIKSRSLTNLKEQFFSEDFLPIQLPCSICHLQKNKTTLLQIYGYPVDYGNNYIYCDKYGKKRLNQFGRSQRDRLVLIDQKQYKIGYAVNTREGQSGCPIILGKKIIGIHNGGGKKAQNFNIGRLITCDLVENIIKWCKELKGDPFQISYKNVCLHLQVAINEYRNSKTPIQLFLFDQNIKIFKVKNGPSVIILNLANNQLEEIDLSDFYSLMELDISLNKLKEIDLRNSQSLYQLNLQNNHLESIDLSYNIYLRSIDLSHNNLSNINITKNGFLTNINISFNHLEKIDLKSNKALTCLLINNNQLSSLDLTNNPNLVHLLLYQNCIQALDLTNNKLLQSLNADQNCLKVILVWITSTISIKYYLDKTFSFSNQKAKNCKVRLMHLEKDLLDCFRVHKAWEQKYLKEKGENDQNKTNCNYLFEYLRKS